MNRPTFRFTVALGAAIAGGCAGTLEDPRSRIAYGCNDVVVIGRLNNLTYEHVEIENDLLGHGWMTSHVTVSRHLKGRDTRRTLPIRYFGHTYLREDMDFLLVLTRSGRGAEYSIRSSHLLDDNGHVFGEGVEPRLANHCN